MAGFLLMPWVMKTLRFFGFAALALAACGGSSSSPNAPTDVDPPLAVSSASRVTSPAVPAADAAALNAGNAAFAADLYQTLRSDPAFASQNVFFSPHSISLALAMAYAGARGNTEKELGAALHYTLPQAQLHPAFDALDLALSSRGEGQKGVDHTPFRLRVVNSLWGSPTMAFVPAFLDTLSADYGAGVRLTDFAKDADAARLRINGWVEQQTEKRIVDLLAPDQVTPLTKLVLVNAIYFNASWASVFEKQGTHDAPFHALDGSTSAASLMSQTTMLPYVKGDGFQAVGVPYAGNELSFIAVLPDAGTFAKFEEGFSGEKVGSIAGALKTAQVALSLPKFKIEGASFSLKSALEARGVKDAFDPGHADFSGLADPKQGPLWIGDVIHKAFISVNEEGTEAAAATAVVAVGTAAPPPEKVELTLDRPFVFAIRDNATGAVLFLGRVIKP